MANRICFVELPVGTAGPVKAFYTDAFGFAMTDVGATFSFPGGKRFHFRDPAGNELAAMQAD